MQKDTYKEIREFVYPTPSVPVNAIVTVHIPDLTEEEHAKRMKEVYRTSERLIIAGMQAEAERRKKGAYQ